MAIGTDDGQRFDSGIEYLIATSRMPPQGSTEPTGALKLAGQYDTPLDSSQEENFQSWKAKNAPKDSGEDYDLRGAFKAGAEPAENGHWPDTWKKPNHPTFSDQSIYAKDRPDLAGTWDGETYVPPKKLKMNALQGTQVAMNLKTASPFVTITDEDIDKGMGLGMAFSGGGLSTIRKGPQMRRGANDNVPDLYNPREPNMIGSKAMDESMEQTWAHFGRGQDIINQRSQLMDKMRDSGLNDLEKQKLKNLNKQHEEHFRDPNGDINGINSQEAIQAVKDSVKLQSRVTELYKERAKLHEIRKDRDFSEVDMARFNKIAKEINTITKSNEVPLLTEPLKKYESAKDLDTLIKEFEDVFSKLEE